MHIKLDAINQDVRELRDSTHERHEAPDKNADHQRDRNQQDFVTSYGRSQSSALLPQIPPVIREIFYELELGHDINLTGVTADLL